MTLQEAVRLAKLQQYGDALRIFDSLYDADEQQFGVWELFYYSKCLRKAQHFSRAVKLNRLVYISMPENEPNRNAYAWNLYDLYVKQVDDRRVDEPKMFKIAAFVIEMTTQDKYSPYERTVFAVLKHLKSKGSPPWHLFMQWLGKLDPSLLNKDPIGITDTSGVVRELASPFEEWHYNRVIGLFGLEQWEACIAAVDEALQAIASFHYNHHIWIRIKKAVSVSMLGDAEEATRQLEQIGIESNHWLAYHELFKLYSQLGDKEKALRSAAVALLSRSGESKHKMKLLLELGAMLEELNLKREALQHYSLVRDLRAHNGWPLIERLVSRITSLENETGLTKAGNPRELERYWNSLRLSKLEKSSGIVQKLIGEGKSGFIAGDESGAVFFRASDVIGKARSLLVGQRVSFYVTDSYDRKKQRITKQAIEIRLIE